MAPATPRLEADTRYAGHESTGTSSGVRATITQLRAPSVAAGHAAAWIGVGGPGAGPNGETMWLQAGLAALPKTPVMLYAEITRAGPRAGVPAARAERPRRQGSPPRRARDEPATRRLAGLARRSSRPPTRSSSKARTGSGSRSPRPRRGTAASPPAIASGSASSASASPVARRLVATVRARIHVPRPRPRRPSAAPRLRSPANARRGSDRAVRLRRALLVER